MMGRKKDSTELKDILKKIPVEKQYIGKKLVEEILFLQETLEELKKKVRENGTEELFVQGKQNFVRESTALKSYNATVDRYSKLYKQLTELIPKEQEEPSSAIYDFLKEGTP